MESYLDTLGFQVSLSLIQSKCEIEIMLHIKMSSLAVLSEVDRPFREICFAAFHCTTPVSNSRKMLLKQEGNGDTKQMVTN